MTNPKMTQDNTYQTSLRLPKELHEKIVSMASANERKPSEQIRYMLKEYIKIKEG
jgi:hypothetical protein